MWTSLGGSPKPRMTPCQPRIKKDPGPWLTKAGLSKRDDYYSLPNGLHQQPQKCFYLNPGLTLVNTTKTQQKHNKNTTMPTMPQLFLERSFSQLLLPCRKHSVAAASRPHLNVQMVTRAAQDLFLRGLQGREVTLKKIWWPPVTSCFIIPITNN